MAAQVYTEFELSYAPAKPQRMCKSLEQGCEGLLITGGELMLTLYYDAPNTKPGNTKVEKKSNKWHWDCATDGILAQMKAIGSGKVTGFEELKPADKEAVTAAIARGTVHEAPVKKAPTVTGKRARSNSIASMSQNQNRPVASSSKSILSPETSLALVENRKRRSSSSASRSAAEQDEEEEDNPEADDEHVFVRSFGGKVVGVQHYSGLVGVGEEVDLVREPQNRYDSNAIQVKNVRGTQVGHIPRDIASRMAPIMDQGLIRLEGQMVQGNQTSSPYTLQLNISIFAAPASVSGLAHQLDWTSYYRTHNLAPVRAPPVVNQTGVTGSQAPRGVPRAATATPQSSPVVGALPGETPAQTVARQQELQRVLSTLNKVDGDENRAGAVLQTLTDVQDALDLPLHPSPPGRDSGEMNIELLPYQSQGLQWMLQAENPKVPTSVQDKPVQLVQYQQPQTSHAPIYYNMAAKSPSLTPPVLGRGGLLADAMGLGKTVQVLSLIIATRNQKPPSAHGKSTLIVAPLSVLSNWTKQIDEHVRPNLLSVHVYHGEGRKISAAKLAAFDIVLTTYQTLSGELADEAKPKKKKKKVNSDKDDDDDPGPAKKKAKPKDGVLLTIKWKRVVLDEGQAIRNHKSKTARAAFKLDAWSRWVLSGTPIINGPADLGALVTFLQVCKPLNDDGYFKRLLIRPLAVGNEGSVRLLKALMSSISLRRSKEMERKDGSKLVTLPKLTFYVCNVDLDKEDRALYDEIAEESQRQVAAYLSDRQNTGQAAAQSTPTYANVLSLLTRLRQLALHSGLLPPNFLCDLRAKNGAHEHSVEAQAGIEMSTVSDEDQNKLQVLLRRAVADNEECPICYDILSNPRITPCAHCFCLPCIEQVISMKLECPMDRRQLDPKALFELQEEPVDEEGETPDAVMADATTLKSSAKVRELVKLLKLANPRDKSLVFSQFTSFLTLVEPHLQEAGISYCRFDGSMPVKKRDQIIRQFSQPIVTRGDVKNPQVMLISLKSGSVGLNLTAANAVYLLDPWWQNSVEAQAIDRAHRLGQTKEVSVFQLIARGTVEAKVLEIQQRKQDLVSQAFSGTRNAFTAQQKRQARFDELQELFNAGMVGPAEGQAGAGAAVEAA